MPNLFTPGTGFAQSQYLDQQATALPGMLAFASDERLVDSYIVADSVGADGLEAGLGVVTAVIPADEHNYQREGMNTKYISLPSSGKTAADFEGITVRNQQMDTNAEGRACWFGGRMANVIRAKRIGGRVWVLLSNGASVVDGVVYWIISDTTSHGKPIGSFSSVALGADTVALTSAKFKSNSDASSNSTIALMELGEVDSASIEASIECSPHTQG